MGWTVSVASDAYEGAWREDHRPMHERFHITVYNERGERFGHVGAIWTTEWHGNEAGERAEKFADRVRTAIAADPLWVPLSDYWNEMQPVYGSEAYVAGGGDWEFQMDHEEREAYLRAR